MRGARGDAPARARGEQGAPPGERVGALRLRRPCALRAQAVWVGEVARQRRRPTAQGTRGPRAAGADGCGADRGLAARGRGARPADCPPNRPPVRPSPVVAAAPGGSSCHGPKPRLLRASRPSGQPDPSGRAGWGRASGRCRPLRAGLGRGAHRSARGPGSAERLPALPPPPPRPGAQVAPRLPRGRRAGAAGARRARARCRPAGPRSRRGRRNFAFYCCFQSLSARNSVGRKDVLLQFP